MARLLDEQKLTLEQLGEARVHCYLRSGDRARRIGGRLTATEKDQVTRSVFSALQRGRRSHWAVASAVRGDLAGAVPLLLLVQVLLVVLPYLIDWFLQQDEKGDG